MTAKQQFPMPNFRPTFPTRDAAHAYAGVFGDWLKACRPKRKHWWHASLRPSLCGLTTGVVNAGIDFELELNLKESLLVGRRSDGAQLGEALNGQSAAAVAKIVEGFLIAGGIDPGLVPAAESRSDKSFDDFDTGHARYLGDVLSAVSAAMRQFRAGIVEETSPIQLWPHHFDLSMLWLPGEKIDGQDPANEEYSDKQMNFGFTFGDEGIPEPYFYVTAYPLPDEFPSLALPAGTQWKTEGFSGAVLLYKTLLESDDPNGYLLDLWTGLLSAGHDHMLDAQ